MIEEYNYFIRVISIGSGLMLLALIVSNEVRTNLKIPLVGMVVGVVGYLINSTPLTAPQGLVDPWIDLVALSTPFFIWLFARNLFERDPTPRLLKIVIPVLLTGWFLANFIPQSGLIGFFILHLASLGLIVDLVRVGIFEREDDLVEQRRIIRLWLPLLVAAQAGSILVFEMLEVLIDIESRSPGAQLVNSLIILVLMLFAGIALMQTDQELLVKTGSKEVTEDEPAPIDLTPAESVLHEKLIAAMQDGAYREPGLTIATLAAKLDTPEHRLRALINQKLGYRNFSAFLNRHRIAEARDKLSSRDDVDLPVLTIAMDLGYNSLPTFNRAFRAETGTTPSEFRRLSFNGGSGEASETAVQN